MSYGIREDQNILKKRHTPEEIVANLRQVDVVVSQGTPVTDADRGDGGGSVMNYSMANSSTC